jgi:hypothetical protein
MKSGARGAATRAPQGNALDDGPRDERRRLDAGGAQFRRMHEGAVEPRRIGVEQQLRRIEPMAGARIARAVGAQAVARAGTDAGRRKRARTRRSARRSGIRADLARALLVEQAELDAFGASASARRIRRRRHARALRARPARASWRARPVATQTRPGSFAPPAAPHVLWMPHVSGPPSRPTRSRLWLRHAARARFRRHIRGWCDPTRTSPCAPC